MTHTYLPLILSVCLLTAPSSVAAEGLQYQRGFLQLKPVLLFLNITDNNHFNLITLICARI